MANPPSCFMTMTHCPSFWLYHKLPRDGLSALFTVEAGGPSTLPGSQRVFRQHLQKGRTVLMCEQAVPSACLGVCPRGQARSAQVAESGGATLRRPCQG